MMNREKQASVRQVAFVSRPVLLVLIGVGLTACVAGCDPAGDTRVPVRGTVRFQGRPLPGGTIVFAPDADRNSGRELAVAPIRYDGGFELQADQAGGVLPGWYRISVTASNPSLRLPAKYRDPVLSGLECEVKTGRSNVIDLDLK